MMISLCCYKSSFSIYHQAPRMAGTKTTASKNMTKKTTSKNMTASKASITKGMGVKSAVAAFVLPHYPEPLSISKDGEVAPGVLEVECVKPGASRESNVDTPWNTIARSLDTASKPSATTGYASHWKSFRKFCNDTSKYTMLLGISEMNAFRVDRADPNEFLHPNSPSDMIAFMVHEIEVANNGFGTIERVRSACKHFYKHVFWVDDGWSNSSPYGNPADSQYVKMTVNSLKKIDSQSGRTVKRAKVVRIEELESLHKWLNSNGCNWTSCIKQYLWSISVVAFCCFLRIGEVRSYVFLQ